MANKFIRGMIFNSGSATARASYMLKFMYEFWGFCIFGGTSIGTPGFGALAGSTTIAIASNGQTLPQATINVASTAAAPASGTIFVHTSTGTHAVVYTGKGATTFTGCTGGTGTMSTGNVVNSFAATSMPGNFIGATTIVSTVSNGLSLTQTTTIAIASNGQVLPQATINVASTTGFPASGTIFVTTSAGQQLVTYTGIGATTFTGCTGGTGTMSTGGVVTAATVHVVSTVNFPTSGTVNVFTNLGTQIVTYTGTTATSFTGCTGGIGTMSTGGNVTSSSIMTLGTDGYTNATTIFRMDGYSDFYSTSANFNSNMVGKQLVTWKSGSNSSEDSIYNIINFKDANNIVVNVNNGGTPSAASDGYRPSFTTRSSINYRVVDIGVAAAFTGVGDGSFIVFQLDPTAVNAGQATPQLQPVLAGGNLRFDFRMSPNGSWTGSAFGVDASGLLSPNSSAGGISFFNSTPSGQTQSINLIGDKQFLIGHSRDSGNTHSAGYQFHFEIPERLYTLAQDPNPFAVSFNGYNTTQFSTTSTTTHYGGGFVMRCNDGIYRTHRGLSKASTGDGNATPNFNSLGALANIFGNALTDYRVSLTPVYGSVMSSQAILCLPGVAGQFSLARARLKTIRFSNSGMPLFTRFASNGDFIQLTQGVSVVWDKTVLPYTLFPF